MFGTNLYDGCIHGQVVDLEHCTVEDAVHLGESYYLRLYQLLEEQEDNIYYGDAAPHITFFS